MFSLPDPLHPAVVHLPLALAVAMPLLAVAAVVAIRLRLLPARTWLAVVVLQAVLVGTSWLALETGEDQEERVEEVVAERHIEAHEEQAERFQVAGLVALVILGAGLLPGTAGVVGRGAGLVACLLGLAAALQVGRSGGELVYRYGAADAYVEAARQHAGARDTAPREREDDVD